jgi:phosphatidylserine synthase
MYPFLPYLIASFIAAGTWTMVAIKFGQQRRQFMGLGGAWAATVVLAALLQAEAIPWLGEIAMIVVLVWLGSVGLLAAAAVLTWSARERGRGCFIGCAVVGIIANVVAGSHFLWLATVSSGGV